MDKKRQSRLNEEAVIIQKIKCPHCGEVVLVYWKPKENNKYA